MTPKEATAVLTKCATFDRRKPDAEASVSWAQALGDATLAEALAAVIAHHASSDEYCRPAHVRAVVEARRRERLARTPEPDFPPELTGAEHAAALTAWRRRTCTPALARDPRRELGPSGAVNG